MIVKVSPADIAARQAVLRALSEAHDRFTRRHAEFVEAGNKAEAAGAWRYADWCLRAYRAELDNRAPKDLR